MNIALRLLLYAAIGYGVLVLAAYLLQRQMVYFPDPEKPLESQVRAVGLRFWPDAGGDYRGFTNTTAPAGDKGLVVAFHGNAGGALGRNYYARALGPLGYQAVVAEYPGYGGRSGELGELPLVADAKETVKQAYAEFGGPVYLLGESLGCGVAAAVAFDPPVPVQGMVLITPWDSLSNLAQTLYWYLPARWLVRDKYDSISNLRSYDKPIAVFLAERDEIIPRKHAMLLYESITAPKRLWIFEGAGHNSWPADSNEVWWREAMKFVSTNPEGNGI